MKSKKWDSITLKIEGQFHSQMLKSSIWKQVFTPGPGQVKKEIFYKPPSIHPSWLSESPLDSKAINGLETQLNKHFMALIVQAIEFFH